MAPIGDPKDKPAFLDPERANSIGYVGAPPDAEPKFDNELAAEMDPAYMDEQNPPEGKGPSRGYRERWRAIARYHALGKSNNWICGKLGYSPTAVSLALKSEWVQSEVTRFRTAYESDIVTRVKDAATDGVTVIHEIINDAKEKSTIRLDAAKWAVEKTSGKARQEVSVESGTLMAYMDLLRQQLGQNAQTPALEAPRDVTPEAALQEDKFDTWLDKNLTPR